MHLRARQERQLSRGMSARARALFAVSCSWTHAVSTSTGARTPLHAYLAEALKRPGELERRRAATHSWYLAYKQALVASVQARVRALERKTPRER